MSSLEFAVQKDRPRVNALEGQCDVPIWRGPMQEGQEAGEVEAVVDISQDCQGLRHLVRSQPTASLQSINSTSYPLLAAPPPSRACHSLMNWSLLSSVLFV